MSKKIDITKKKGFQPMGLFSQKELEIIDSICFEYHSVPTSKIIDELHKEGYLWQITATENGILTQLISGNISTTRIELDFRKLIHGDENKMLLHSILIENLLFSEALNN